MMVELRRIGNCELGVGAVGVAVDMLDTRSGEVGAADSLGSCERRPAPMEEEAGGSSCAGRSEGGGGGGGGEVQSCDRYSRSLGSHGSFQGPLPMATTPPLSPEHLELGEARCKAEFSRYNTWDRIAAAGLYAFSLWKLSQEMIEEKARGFVDIPVGKQKVH